MPVKLAWTRKAFDEQLTLLLLALLDEISAAVNDLGIDQPDLVHLARSLHRLDKCVNQLHAEVAAVAVDELLLIYSQHLGDVGDKVE